MRSLLLSLQRFCILSLNHDSTPLSASLNLTFSLSLQLSSSAALDMGLRSSFLWAPSPENASLPPPSVKMGKRRDSAAVFSLRISSLPASATSILSLLPMKLLTVAFNHHHQTCLHLTVCISLGFHPNVNYTIASLTVFGFASVCYNPRRCSSPTLQMSDVARNLGLYYTSTSADLRT